MSVFRSLNGLIKFRRLNIQSRPGEPATARASPGPAARGAAARARIIIKPFRAGGVRQSGAAPRGDAEPAGS